MARTTKRWRRWPGGKGSAFVLDDLARVTIIVKCNRQRGGPRSLEGEVVAGGPGGDKWQLYRKSLIKRSDPHLTMSPGPITVIALSHVSGKRGRGGWWLFGPPVAQSPRLPAPCQ